MYSYHTLLNTISSPVPLSLSNTVPLQIVFGKNSITSRWVDIEELAQAQDLDILNGKGEPVTEEFLINMDLYRKRDPAKGSGIVWRWLVDCDDDTDTLSLMVQALPCDLKKIKATAALRDENTKGIRVACFPIHYSEFDNLRGPVPTFFSSDPAATYQMLMDSPRTAFDYMQALASKLYAAGTITR